MNLPQKVRHYLGYVQTLMPFAFMKSINNPEILFNTKIQWLGERKEGIEKTSKLFKSKKIKIMQNHKFGFQAILPDI